MRTISTRARGTSAVSLNGPVPDGAKANFSQLPSLAYWAGDEIRNHSIWYGNSASTALVVTCTVIASSAFQDATDGSRGFTCAA